MNDYLSAHELAELVGCKLNQRSMMIQWLELRRWRFVIDRFGLPKVARAYHNKKMGISEEVLKAKYAETPNLQAFAS
ncbi:MAG: protein of unknown function (DUF4224) [Glomeribacter sp. 1016415]|nr:protein of unknown function (DUF4224) [Glomeribacter sp. 1016415]